MKMNYILFAESKKYKKCLLIFATDKQQFGK